MPSDPPIACDPTGIDADEHDTHDDIATAVFESITDLHDLSDGYAFRLPTETEPVQKAGALVNRERLCRPFFNINLAIPPDQGSVRLKRTGRDGGKEDVEDAVLPYWTLAENPAHSGPGRDG